MITVELSERELELLITLLEHDQSELLTEIAHTDARPFRMGLKVDSSELKALLATLKKSAQAISNV